MTTPPLFPCQENAAARLAKGEPIYLAFDMGLGKSRTFIEAAKRRDAQRVLVLCPTSARLVWKREIQRWDPGAQVAFVDRPEQLATGARYTVVTHGMFSQRDGNVIGGFAFCRPFDLTAIDEAHAFNAADTLRVKALTRAQAKLGLVVPLSGTPIRNHAGDIYNMLRLCYPEGLESGGEVMHRFAFEAMFCRVADRVFNHHRVRVIEGSKNLAMLRTRLAPFMVRVRKGDVLKDLPPILWDQVPVPLLDTDPLAGSRGAELHDMVVQAMTRSTLGKQVVESAEDFNAVTAAIARLAVDARVMALRRLLGVAKLRGASEYLVDMLNNLPRDRKVLVFAVHADVISVLKNQLGEYDPAVIVGGTSPRDRDIAVEKFLAQSSCRVFVGNIQAAGTALTLVGPTCKCSDVVFVESSWTAADNAQAACRVHRIGQQDGVVVRMLTADSTIEELVHTILLRKSQEFSQLFDEGGEVQ